MRRELERALLVSKLVVSLFKVKSQGSRASGLTGSAVRYCVMEPAIASRALQLDARIALSACSRDGMPLSAVATGFAAAPKISSIHPVRIIRGVSYRCGVEQSMHPRERLSYSAIEVATEASGSTAADRVAGAGAGGVGHEATQWRAWSSHRRRVSRCCQTIRTAPDTNMGCGSASGASSAPSMPASARPIVAQACGDAGWELNAHGYEQCQCTNSTTRRR